MSNETQQAIDSIARWGRDPVAFCREVCRIEPDAWQVEVLEALLTNDRICLCASKGPGKSLILAIIAWWFLVTKPHPKVIATSITGDNLRDGLWSEMSKIQQRSDLLKKNFIVGAEQITMIESAKTWFMSARTWAHGADAVQQGNTLAGIHADHVLFVVDEAGDIPDAVVASAEAGLANSSEEHGRTAKLVIAGNPTRLSGPLYRATTSESDLWYVKRISGDPDDPNRAPRVSLAWAEAQIRKFGRNNPWVLVNVFGQFPPSQSNALLGIEEVAASMLRESPSAIASDDETVPPRILGVDVARFGDDRTVIFAREGRNAFAPWVFRNLDTQQVADEVKKVMDKWQPDAVFIDDGGVGGGVTDRLRALGQAVVGVNFGSAAQEPEYANKRMEMWYRMANWLKHEDGTLPNDEELKAELVAPTYDFDEKQRMLLESKKKMKARGLPSPDKADALVLTFAHNVIAKPRNQLRIPGEREQRVLHDHNPFAVTEA